MDSDIEIAQKAKLKPILGLAKSLGLKSEEVELYGRFKAKVDFRALARRKRKKDGKLILVTSMTPTRAGEGKTTVTIGLAQALKKIGLNPLICVREPSLGPCFGIKGGAAGGGFSQVLPMEDINLEFTGDIPAVTAANNLLSAVIDNHLHYGNKLGIDTEKISFKRATDMNDRTLRRIRVGLEGSKSFFERGDSFQITAASEVMAILCLAQDIEDLKKRLGRIIVGFTKKGEPVRVRQLKVEGAMAALLKDAINPNLVQSIEGVPAFVHGGPFGNIAHGASSLIATKLALKLSDYVVTEAGFGSDLGAEKFFDIKCRVGALRPSAAVVVATVRALRMHGKSKNYEKSDIKAVKLGFRNLKKHIENTRSFGVPVVVAVNKFSGDSKQEIESVLSKCKRMGVSAVVCDVHAKGGAGGIQLAKKVGQIAQKPIKPRLVYKKNDSIKRKIEKIATRVYGASGVKYTSKAEKHIRLLTRQGLGGLLVCMSKTQKSLSDDPKKLGRPRNFKITVRNVTPSAGAGFLVALCGDVLTMPGLPEKPAAENIDVNNKGEITGLF